MPSLAEPLPEPVRLARRSADAWPSRMSRDRLATMLILAALLHGLVILGVTFSPVASPPGAIDQGIEVLLVSEELAEAEKNPTATYLSQRTQMGSGNSKERLSARVPSRAQAADPGRVAALETPASQDQVLTTNRRSVITIGALSTPEIATANAQERTEVQAAGDDELRLRGERRDELYITADTRASRLAPYLDSWRRRVERVGTINFPSAAQRRNLSGNPVIEVALGRDGRLQSARVQRSSGHAQLDAAALEILRLASPFDPFPPDVARDYRVIHIAYEYQFVGGQIAETAISVP